MDLRIIIDSLEPVEGDLGVVLGNVRYRMRAAIEHSGVRLVWNVDPLPPLPDLSPEKVLSIQRVLMEALSNALQHSGAKTITVSARHEASSGGVFIDIADDGRGFGAAASGGRGLRNMRARAQRAGFALNVSSSPGGGTVVELVLPVQQPAAPGAPEAAELLR
jgi:signal transduction histidine kinase